MTKGDNGPNGTCFACDRKLGTSPHLVDTRDGQTVFVGSKCYQLIKAAGERGYQPPLGGPRLYLMPAECDCQCPQPLAGVSGV